MKLDKAIENALKSIPKAVAAGVVDMSSGMMLDMKTTSSHPQQVFDFLAAATKDMFEGENVTTIEEIFKKARGVKNDDRYIQEVVFFSTHLIHYFSRLPNDSSMVFGVVCSIDASVGLVLAKAREARKNIEI